MTRPYVLLSAAMSVDGYLDDNTPERLLLSNAEDFDRVDEVRAGCDAILIGANTIRRDNPRLLVNSEERRAARVARGLPAYPTKVTITTTGLDTSHKFFHTGDAKIIYTTPQAHERLAKDFDGLADVVDAGDPVDFGAILDDLGARGIKRLMVEGGGQIHTKFLTENLADEIQLAIAPFFVGDDTAPRFVGPGTFPQDAKHRMQVKEVRQLEDITVIKYALGYKTTP